MTDRYDSLVELWARCCDKFADRELFGEKGADGWRFITFKEFKRRVDDCRAGLAALGVGDGDRVAIISNNRVEWAVAAHATYGLGAAYVPMYEVQPPDEWQFILADCSAKVCITSTRAIFEVIEGLRGALPELRHVVLLDAPPNEEASFAALLQRGAQKPVDHVLPPSGHTAGLIYTSGTTGKPKGVVLSHGNICSNVNEVQDLFPIGPSDRTLAFLPWAHSFGQTAELHVIFSMGASMAINDDVANLVANLAEVKPTILFAVPRIFNRIYDGVNKQMAEKPGFIRSLFRGAIRTATKRSRGEDVSALEGLGLAVADRIIFSKIRAKFGGRLRYAISGSAALSREVAEFIDALGIQVYEGYGLTETSPVVSVNYPGHRKIGSVGKPLPGVRVVIDTAVTGDPKNGEIVIYGPNVMQGYHRLPEETAQVLGADGGLRTGDMGYLDADGYLYITGRIKEQYKLENGKYIVPAPLEEELKLSPYIANVMLHGSNQPHNVALVVPDMPALEKWAQENGVTLGDVAYNPRVKQLLAAELERYSAGFKSYERPKDLLVTTEDFTQANNLLTPKMSLKRRNVMQKYEAALDALYTRQH